MAAWRPLLRQLALLLAVTVALAVWLAIWGPPDTSPLWLARRHPGWFGGTVIGVWLGIDGVLWMRAWLRRRPAPPTRLGRFTFWCGVVSALSLILAPLTGCLAVFLAPTGLVTGAWVLVRELRARSGHEAGSLAGVGLCVAALVFLAA